MTSAHDNFFTFKIHNVTKAEFYLNDYNISSGQPWNGVKLYDFDKNGITLNATAGRHKTKAVANWFNEKCKPGRVIGVNSIDDSPYELNFAFLGNLRFTLNNSDINVYSILIGQGHNTLNRNNWFVGGPNFKVSVTLDVGVKEIMDTYSRYTLSTPRGESVTQTSDEVNLKI